MDAVPARDPGSVGPDPPDQSIWFPISTHLVLIIELLFRSVTYNGTPTGVNGRPLCLLWSMADKRVLDITADY